jgi:NAD(P)-dependent dehydrogenase (short-subunit alcohol dehydrogenase family)
MKLQHQINADINGTVKSVNVSVGSQVKVTSFAGHHRSRRRRLNSNITHHSLSLQERTLPMSSLKNRTIFITGASRGIGREIALRCARDGANIIVAAKTAEPHAKLEGTIFETAEAVEKAGGKALPIQMDVREESQVREALAKAAAHFGGIDAIVNNAGAIGLSNSELTAPKKFDLMMGINARAVYLVTHCALPYLKKSSNAHVLSLSPPHEPVVEMAETVHPLYAFQIRHDLAQPRHGGRTARTEHCRQYACGRARFIATAAVEFSVGAASESFQGGPQAGNHGRCRLRDPAHGRHGTDRPAA